MATLPDLVVGVDGDGWPNDMSTLWNVTSEEATCIHGRMFKRHIRHMIEFSV